MSMNLNLDKENLEKIYDIQNDIDFSIKKRSEYIKDLKWVKK